MIQIYKTLCTLDYFIDNEYLKHYCTLIERNHGTKQFHNRTHKHHIIPRCWFKLKTLTIDDTSTNLVNLPYRDHILAHYYLCLCTEDPFKYANQLALICLQNKNQLSIADTYLLENLPMYNNIYEDYIYKLKSKYKLY